MSVLDKKYLHLVIYKAIAGLRADAARNYLSFAWWVLEPVIGMAVYYVVFGLVMQRGTKDFVPFLLIGLVAWQWTDNTIKQSAGSILQGARLMSQVDIPKGFFPSVSIVMVALKWTIVFSILLVFLAIYGMDITITYSALPLVMLAQFLMSISISYLVGSIIPFLPDLRYLIDAFLRFTFFLSGVFYPAALVPERYQTYFYLNPMVSIIESYRKILMYNQWPDFPRLSIILLVSSGLLYVALKALKRFDHIYPRIVT